MTRGEEIPLDPASALARTIERVERAGPMLRALDPARVDRAIATAAATLADGSSALGRQARESVPSASGLSPAGVEHALETTCTELGPASIARARAALATLGASFALTPVRLAGLVLAANVFTAGLRPLVWALLCRTPVVAKVASTDAGLSELFSIALALADEEVGAAIGIARFSRSEPEHASRLAGAVDVLSVHGSDRTIAELRAAAPATTEVVGHGHGLGLAIVPARALGADGDPGPVLRALALDVAAYDQRGCLSPHAILVERGGATSARELARRLSTEGLATLARTMPRGALGTLEGAVQVRWRGVAQALGELFEGDGWSVSFEETGPIRACPLHRNVAVHEVPSIDHALARAASFGAHLKAIGVAGPPELRAEIAAALPPGLAPRICEVGAMQRPPLEAATDGVPPWQGLVRLSVRS